LALGPIDTSFSRRPEADLHDVRVVAALTACSGRRAPLPDAIMVSLHNGAFPETTHPDVAVHVPPGFDATRRPGLVLYFHGWQGCAAAALSEQDLPCDGAGPLRSASNLARQLDEAEVNAILVAIELRVDAPTGEPGRLAMPAGGRELLRELFAEHLADPLGCALPVDAFDRIVIVAHSGGYQAAASVISQGDLPQVTEVILLDALYGAKEVFARWIADDIARFDARVEARLRFVDLYTCCGGTSELSRSMEREVQEALAEAGLPEEVYADDGDGELDAAALARPVVFKRVPRPHGALPRAYVGRLLEASGFAHIRRLP